MSLMASLPDLVSAYVASSLTPFGGVDPLVDWRDAFLMLLSPLFFAIVVAEWLRMRGEKRQGKAVYDWRDSLDSMVLGGVYTWVDVVLVLVMVLGVGLKLDPRYVPSPLIDKPMPEFSLPLLEEESRKLSRYQRRAVRQDGFARRDGSCMRVLEWKMPPRDMPKQWRLAE